MASLTVVVIELADVIQFHGDSVRVLGFPRYMRGASVHVQEGKISHFSPWHGVDHFVVDCPIIRSASLTMTLISPRIV